MILIAVAILVAAGAGLIRVLREKPGFRQWLQRNRMGILVFALFLATPVAEALYGFAGSDLFGSRNLVAASPGLFLAIGAVLSAAGPVWGGICGIAVIGGFAVGTVKSMEDSARTIDYNAAAARIDDQAGPGDVVVDLLSAPITPAPLTPLGRNSKARPRSFR
ncbi:MAG: hypothetical protein IPK93_03845 [Solirubrobacterales bacterium]|nr:hypothetical protein [Solirubrobacterales bacterium]